MIGSCPSWHADGTLTLASQQVILSDDLEAPFQDLLDWSSSAVAMRALTAKRKTHSGIELKQTTHPHYIFTAKVQSIHPSRHWTDGQSRGFSIKWPTDRVKDLYEYLKSLPADLVLDMKSAVDRDSARNLISKKRTG